MTTFAMTLPVARGALHIPRRDLVLDASDSLLLQLTLVASDTPGAAAFDLSGIGVFVRMLMWNHAEFGDYGRGRLTGSGTASTGSTATIAPGTAAQGRADIRLPRGFGSRRGLRIGWALQLQYPDDAWTLAYGALHRQIGGASMVLSNTDILDDFDIPITDDAGQDVEI